MKSWFVKRLYNAEGGLPFFTSKNNLSRVSIILQLKYASRRMKGIEPFILRNSGLSTHLVLRDPLVHASHQNLPPADFSAGIPSPMHPTQDFIFTGSRSWDFLRHSICKGAESSASSRSFLGVRGALRTLCYVTRSRMLHTKTRPTSWRTAAF